MDHGFMYRLNPKGERGIFRCRNCGFEGTTEQLAKTPCKEPNLHSQEDDLMTAIRGDS